MPHALHGRLVAAWVAVLTAAAVAAVRTPAEAERPAVARPGVEGAQVLDGRAPVPGARRSVKEPPADRWALVVGVSAYRGRVSRTIGGANDAFAVRKALLKNGWRADHIKMLVDDAATGTAIRAGMRWLVAKSASRGFSFFHFSGHVKQKGGHEYLWPVDSKLISDSEVVATLGKLRGYAWLDFAGCEAGGFDDGLSSPRRLVTGSSQATEKSFEWPDWKLSVWTGIVFERGFVYGEADRNNDRRVTIREAIDYGVRFAPVLTRYEVRWGYSPQHPYVAGGDGRDWALDAPPVAPR